MSTLTDKQAYLAMFAFLESHYERTGSDDIGALPQTVDSGTRRNGLSKADLDVSAKLPE